MRDMRFSILKDKQDFPDLPIITVKAHHPVAQEMFWGNLTLERVNLGRLSQFKGRQIKLHELITLPHPYR
ncbi:hypothetical protein D3C87_2131970 [compost metagenome]